MDVLISAVIFYFGASLFLYFYQRNLLYFPDGPRPQIEMAIAPQTLTVTPEEGIQIDGWYWPAENNKPTLIFFHGNGQAYQYWAHKMEVYYSQGYGVLFTDYRGYGGADGSPSEQGIYEDARHFINALHERKDIAFDNMVFYGESLGTGVAIQMATQFPPKALILESAYTSIPEIAQTRFPLFPANLIVKDRYASIDKIGALTMPKFLIHGQKDRIIPLRFGQKLYNAAKEPKDLKVIPDAGHDDLYSKNAGLHISAFLNTIAQEQTD